MYWNNRIKLTTVGVISAFANVLVIGYFLFQSFDKNNKNEHLVSQSYDVLATSKQLQSVVKDAETAQRGFILTGKTKYLEPLNKSYRIKDSLTERLFFLISKNTHQKEEIDNINYHIKQKYSHINTTLSIRKETGNKAAIDYVNDGKGRNIMDSIRDAFASFDKEENTILNNRQQVLQQSNKKVKNILVIGIWTVIIIFLIAFTSIYKQLRRIRKKEEELYISNEWYNQTLISMGDAVITTDTIGIITTLNKAATELTGWTNEEAKGKNIDHIVKLIDSKNGDKIINPIFNSLNKDNVIISDENTVLIKKNGEKIFIEDSGASINDKRGKIIGAVQIFRDVSARRKAEEERDMFYNISLDIIVIGESTGKIKKANPAFNEILGYNDEEFIDKNFLDFVYADDIKVCKEKLYQLNMGKPIVNSNVRIKCKNGTFKWLEWNVIPVDGLLYANARDITPRKHLEEKIIQLNQSLEKKVEERTAELENQKKFTDGILSKIPTEIAVYDHNQNYLFINPAGVENQEVREWLIGKNDFEYCQLNGSNFKLAEKKRLAFEKLNDYEDAEWIDKIQQPNGSYKYMLRILHPIEGNDKYILTGYDVTDLKLAEEAKENYINNLEQMMFMTSHKVRVPVSNIVGLTKLLEDPMTQEEQLEVISHVKSSIDALDDFTRELTYFLHDLKKKTGR